MHSPAVIFTRPEGCLPYPKEYSAMIFKPYVLHYHGGRAYHLACVEFSCSAGLFKIVNLGSGTDFTVSSSFISPTFNTPRKIFQISLVLTEKQLNEQLSLPSYNRDIGETQYLSASGRLTFFPAMKYHT